MSDVNLEKLLEPHASYLRSIAEAAAKGERDKVIDGAAGLALTLATGNPLIGALAPLARKGIATAFGNATDEMFARELAKMEKDEEKAAFLNQIDDVIAALLSQALPQLVRTQHRVKDEVLAAVGGVRHDFESFRADFERQFKERGDVPIVNDGDARREVDKQLRELAQVLEDRAAKVRHAFSTLNVSVSTDPYRARFEELHKKHIEAVLANQLFRAHELVGDIYQLFRELDLEEAHATIGISYFSAPTPPSRDLSPAYLPEKKTPDRSKILWEYVRIIRALGWRKIKHE